MNTYNKGDDDAKSDQGRAGADGSGDGGTGRSDVVGNVAGRPRFIPCVVAGIDFAKYDDAVSYDETLQARWGAMRRHNGSLMATLFRFLLEHPHERWSAHAIFSRMEVDGSGWKSTIHAIRSALYRMDFEKLTVMDRGLWRLRLEA